MNPRALAALCVVALLVAFAIDLVTPQLLVAAILLDVPIVLSTYAGNRRLTGSLIAAALVANAVAGYVNGITAGGAWDAIGLGDRAFAALSIVLVGALGLAVHRGAERTGAAGVLVEQARRERALREAVEDIRGSLSEELVARGIVREARELLDAARASFFVAAGEAGWASHFEAVRGSREVLEIAQRPCVAVQSVLYRSLESGETSQVSHDDAMGRLVLDALEAQAALIAPLIDARTRFGALVLSFERPVTSEDAGTLRAFAGSAAIALGQAHIFVELAQKNDELAQRSDVIRDIVYALSHDLRTPLAAAGLTLRQARQGAYGAMSPQYLEILDRSITANDELQRLAETLLLVARYESGERTSLRQSVDLTRLLNEVAEQLEPLAHSKGLRVDVSAGEAGFVSGDPGELRRALVNLFANAVTWSRQGGIIRVRVEKHERVVRVRVADEGFGVPEAMREALFTRFSGKGKRGGGTGLGLYIVRRIAEEHKGRVRYEPNQPEGSIFMIELPVLAAPATVSS